jgi:hypothetical protein
MPKGHGIALAPWKGAKLSSSPLSPSTIYVGIFVPKLNGNGNAISHVIISEIDLFVTPYY